MSVAAELVSFVTGVGGRTAGTNLFYGEFKEMYPDDCAIIRETGGIAPEPNLGEGTTPGKGIRLQFPSCQIVCRGVRDDYDGPRAVALALYTKLTSVLNQSIGGIYYVSVDPIQEPFLMRTDETFRSYIAFNVHVIKELS